MRKTPLSQGEMQKDPFEEDIRTVDLSDGLEEEGEGERPPTILPLRHLPRVKEQARGDLLG